MTTTTATLPNITLYRARSVRDGLERRLRSDLDILLDFESEGNELDNFMRRIVTEPSPWITGGWRKFLNNDIVFDQHARLIHDFCVACMLVKVIEHQVAGKEARLLSHEISFASESFQSQTFVELLNRK